MALFLLVIQRIDFMREGSAGAVAISAIELAIDRLSSLLEEILWTVAARTTKEVS
jgi:hypothetical protein